MSDSKEFSEVSLCVGCSRDLFERLFFKTSLPVHGRSVCAKGPPEVFVLVESSASKAVYSWVDFDRRTENGTNVR